MWTLNVRFPDTLKGEVDRVLGVLNNQPERIGAISKNDLIVFAVQRLCQDALSRDERGTKVVNA